MVIIRILLAVIAFFMLSACGTPSRGDLENSVAAAGCSGVRSEYQQLPDRVVLSVSAHQCDRAGGVLLGAGDALMVMARAVWLVPSYCFDSVFLTVYRTDEMPAYSRAVSQEVTRGQLVQRFGQRDIRLDAPVTRDTFRSASDLAWRIIPLGVLLVVALVMAVLVRAIRRGRIAIFFGIR